MSDEHELEESDDSGVLVIRRGPGANCSSIGSAVEMLFLSATVGAAVLAAVVAAMRPRVIEKVDAHRDDPPPPSANSSRDLDPSERG